MARLRGKVALITGGAGGLGSATARRFVEEGCRVAIADVDDDAGESVARELGDDCAFVHNDHLDNDSNAAAVVFAVDTYGGLDILLNNAGAPYTGKIETADDEAVRRSFDSNLLGPFRMTKAAVPALRARARETGKSASILYTASGQAINAKPDISAYTAAKHGVRGLMRSVALELAPDNIRVNCVCPVATDTLLFREMAREMSDSMETTIADFERTVPLGRLARPVDTANAFLFLASDEAEMVTGVALPVDGGMSAY
ncbi:MAG: glucose 1-dehydrogenase [Rhodospirillaceae bacterium]|nr:glucose 1-dehydrogenase [Rhodospirillaceae bacterium]